MFDQHSQLLCGRQQLLVGNVAYLLGTLRRICVLNAFLSHGNGQYGQAVGLYKRALAVLDWGRKAWAKASRKERGAIFDSTFVRGVRTLYATSLVHVGPITLHPFPQKTPVSYMVI